MSAEPLLRLSDELGAGSASQCVRDDVSRVGEAKNPGPRRVRVPRQGSLFDVELIDPA